MNTPSVGSQITVEVHNFSAMLTNPIFHDVPSKRVYSGTVVPNAKWEPSNTFCLTTGDKRFPIRNIAMRNVISIDGIENDIIENKVKTILVNGSKGNVYTVIVDGDNITCSCPGYSFRRSCKHTEQVRNAK